MEKVWMVTCEQNGFTFKVFVRTTEAKLVDYLKTELPNYKSYTGALPREIGCAKELGLPIYCY